MNSLEQLYHSLLQEIGEDPHREGLEKTPERAAAAFQYLTEGYHKNISEIIHGAIFTSTLKDIVLVKDIEVYSLCEHHLLPFFGKCHVGYKPQGKILGLSKIPRIVDMFARRLQIQENLTQQIAVTILEQLQCSGIGVIIEAHHLCTMMRGVQKHEAVMKTSCMYGCFQEPEIQQEFFHLLRS